MMMKQVELRRGTRILRGWINIVGTNGVPVITGASVDVPAEGGRFEVVAVHAHEVARATVKAMQNKARAPFTALKSYRGNK